MKVNNRAILITDPCYILKKENKQNTSLNQYNSFDLYSYGFTDYISRPTIYGDWSCDLFKVIKLNCTKENFNPEDDGISIGKVTADAGCVCVVYVDELLKYNPKFFETHGQWTYTIVPDFKNNNLDWQYDIITHNKDGKEYKEAIITATNEQGELKYILKQTGY